jgi:hypothetical protein
LKPWVLRRDTATSDLSAASPWHGLAAKPFVLWGFDRSAQPSKGVVHAANAI